MQGVKTTGKSNKSLISELSKQVGYVKEEEPELARYDASTGTYYCANLESVPKELLKDAKEHYDAEAVMLRSRAEASLIPGSAALLTKKATYARFAAQAIEKELKRKK